MPPRSAGAQLGRDVVMQCLSGWSPQSFHLTHDGPRRTTDDFSSYDVEWEIKIEPIAPTACGFEIWFTPYAEPTEISAALGLDSWEHLARRVRKSSQSSRFVFGVEPLTMSPKKLVAILQAIYVGDVEASYISLFGQLVSVRGRFTVDIGCPKLSKNGIGKKFQYGAYAA